jgi:hypothetical protein
MSADFAPEIVPERGRRVGRLLFRVLPGKVRRRKRTHKIERWESEGITAGEAVGWRGINRCVSYLAYETARERRNSWGTRTHEAFIARIASIASKSPELRNGSGRSRFYYGAAAERAWLVAKSTRERQRFYAAVVPLGNYPPGGRFESGATADLGCASSAEGPLGGSASVTKTAPPSSPQQSDSQIGSFAGEASAEARKGVRGSPPPLSARRSTLDDLAEVVRQREYHGVTEWNIASPDELKLRAWVVRENHDSIAVGLTRSEMQAIFGANNRMGGHRHMKPLLARRIVVCVCNGLSGVGCTRTGKNGASNGENAIFCISEFPGQPVSAAREAEARARGHVRAAVARCAQKLAARAEAKAHRAAYRHEWIAGTRYCVELATGFATEYATAHAPQAEPSNANPRHAALARLPRAEPRALDTRRSLVRCS